MKKEKYLTIIICTIIFLVSSCTLLFPNDESDTKSNKLIVVESRTDNNYNIGINANWLVDWNPERPFADLMRTWRPWQANESGTETPPPVDENGWPLTDFSALIYDGRKGDNTGTYKIRFTGVGDVGAWSIDFENKVYDEATNTTTVDMIISDTENSTLVLGFSNTNGGIKNIQIMVPVSPGSTESYGFDRILTDQYLDLVEPFSTIRYMDWTHTNNAVDEVWSDSVPWNYASQQVQGLDDEGNFVNYHSAWESLIKVANVTGKDAWICIPHKVDDNYIRELATLFRDGSSSVEPLDSNLNLYIEYSNEVWNYVWPFTQTYWVQAESLTYGHPLDFDDETDEMTMMQRYKAKRSVEISAIFRDVFGDSQMISRIRPVLMWTKGWMDLGSRAITFIDRYYNARDSHSDITDPHPINYYFYGAGGSNYWSHGEGSTSVETIWDMGEWNPTNFADSIYSESAWARSLGLAYITYESDAHYPTAESRQVYWDVHWDERMFQASVEHVDAFNMVGGDLFSFYSLTGQSDSTDWGLYHIYDGLDGSPQYRAVLSMDGTARPTVTYGDLVPFTTPGAAFDTLTYEDPRPDDVGSVTISSNADSFAVSYGFRVERERTSTVVIDYSTTEIGSLEIEYDGNVIGIIELSNTENVATLTDSIDINVGENNLHSIRLVCTSGSVVINSLSIQ